jgi:hypothetical protein
MIKSCVIIENVSAEKRAFPLYTKLTIGRASDNDISLSEPTVSKRHAALGRVRGLPVVKDLGSHNGVFINGQRIEKAVLSTGDSFKVGRVSFRFIQEQEIIDSNVAEDTTKLQFQKKLGEYLVKAGIIQHFTLPETPDKQPMNQTIGQMLMSMGAADDEDIAMGLAKQLNLPLVRLDELEIPQEALSLVPATVAKANLLMPIKITDKLHIAMANPLDSEAIQVARVTSSKSVQIAVTPQRELLEALGRCYVSEFLDQVVDEGANLDVVTDEIQ